MPCKRNNWLVDVVLWPTFGKLPKLFLRKQNKSYHNCQIGGRANDLLVIERIKVKVTEIAPRKKN